MFFKGLAAYVQKFKFKCAETADFRRAMEDATGESLEQFFSQWCYHPGVPQLEIGCDWNSDKHELSVHLEQKQTIDGYNPAFAFSLPVWAETKSGDKVKKVGSIEVNEKEATGVFKLDAEPLVVAIDPELAVLANLTINQPLGWWMAQLDRGPTVVSRIQAARALGKEKSTIGGSLLLQRAGDSRAPEPLRVECVKALAARHDAPRLADLSRMEIKSRDVREALAEASGAILSDEKAEKLSRSTLTLFVVSAAKGDESDRVRSAALRAVGKAKLTDQAGVLVAAAGVESQSDRVRQAALDGLGDLDAADGLPIAMKCAEPGHYNRTRPVAIGAVVKLAHHDHDAAFNALVELLKDRESRAMNTAGAGLVKLGDPRAISALEALEKEKADPTQRQMIEGWIAGLKAQPKK
jgi:aminopeptidase N